MQGARDSLCEENAGALTARTFGDVDVVEGKSEEPDSQNLTWSEHSRKMALWKLDLTVLPILTMFYFFAYLDRSNVGNARIAGLQADLKMSDQQWSIVLTICYIPYILSEVPSNLVLKKIGPHIVLPSLVVMWGTITFCEGLVTSYSGLLAARFYLGLVEGGLFPGIVLYLSHCYSRDQMQFRIAIFFSSALLAGAFSGLLAYSILHLHGTLGKPGWAWIFFLEGGATFLFGALSFFIFPSSIRTNRFLSDSDKDLLEAYLVQKSPTGSEAEERFSAIEILNAIKSPHVLLMALAKFLSGTSVGSFGVFTPTIVKSLGYTASRAQLMSAPPYAVGFVVMVLTGYLSDRFRARAMSAGACALLGVIGFTIYLSAEPEQLHVKYFSLFFSIPGMYSATPPIAAWVSNNSYGHYRRGVAIALAFAAANSGGLLSSWLFHKSKRHDYRTGITVNLVFACATVVTIVANFFWLRWATIYKHRHAEALLEPYHTDSKQSDSYDYQKAWAELGDRHPDFKYVT